MQRSINCFPPKRAPATNNNQTLPSIGIQGGGQQGGGPPTGGPPWANNPPINGKATKDERHKT
ncbi:MAG: hypothetical protein IPO90_07065 [Flavobacteriales bacterium]|nr:hypothetical protein [Flavobacteriales bacterium]